MVCYNVDDLGRILQLGLQAGSRFRTQIRVSHPQTLAEFGGIRRNGSSMLSDHYQHSVGDPSSETVAPEENCKP